MRSISPESNFASSTSLLDLTLPAHNAVLAGDSLTTLALNYKWRKIIAIALQFWFTHGDEGLAATNEDHFEALIQDLYTAEVIGALVTQKSVNIDLTTDKTTTSSPLVAMPGTSYSFTPTKANFKATYSNLTLLNSGNNQTDAEVRFNGVAGSDNAKARNTGTAGRPLRASAVFRGVSVGVAHNIELYWRVSGGTGTANAATLLVLEIEEYD